jgi:hypothetical protein
MRNARPAVALLIAACGLAFPRLASAQRVVPFFSPAGTGFDPEISVVNSGQVLDAQAVVSNDMKYVTINARPSSSQLLALRDFSFQTASNRQPRLGFVGGAGAAAAAAVVSNDRGNGERGNLLDRPGMSFVARLED